MYTFFYYRDSSFLLAIQSFDKNQILQARPGVLLMSM
jgi:hypothetical protein